jgi:GntR family transcriptional regulator
VGDETVDPDSKEPVWRQLAAILRARIESGQYPPGRRIASKNEAMQEFGVADHTYDKAVALLRSEGLVETIRGKGSYVAER